MNGMTNCHMLYQYAIIGSRPDKEIKTMRNNNNKKTQVPIVGLFGSIKENRKVINKVKCLSQACIHTVINLEIYY